MSQTPSAPDRNLALELVRVTEAAALAAAHWMGRGDKEAADQAAVDAMRLMMDSVTMSGTVVIGEGEKDNAPMLYNGEAIGNGEPPIVDVAVDPIDGTTLTAKGQSGALAVVAVAERGTMFDPGPCVYMEKIVVSEVAADVVDIDASVAENLERVAKVKRTAASDLTVVILDRPRHDQLVKEIREVGSRIRFIPDGDVAGAISAARGGHGHRYVDRDRRDARGRYRGLCDQVSWRGDPGTPHTSQRRGTRRCDQRGI